MGALADAAGSAGSSIGGSMMSNPDMWLRTMSVLAPMAGMPGLSAPLSAAGGLTEAGMLGGREKEAEAVLAKQGRKEPLSLAEHRKLAAGSRTPGQVFESTAKDVRGHMAQDQARRTAASRESDARLRSLKDVPSPVPIRQSQGSSLLQPRGQNLGPGSVAGMIPSNVPLTQLVQALLAQRGAGGTPPFAGFGPPGMG